MLCPDAAHHERGTDRVQSPGFGNLRSDPFRVSIIVHSCASQASGDG